MKNLKFDILELETLFNQKKFNNLIIRSSELEKTYGENFSINFLKGSAFMSINKFENAEFFLKRASDLNPKNIVCLYNLSLTLRKQLKHNESFNYLMRAFYLDKNNYLIKNEMGNHYYLLKNYKLANEFYSEIYHNLKKSKGFINFYSDTLVKIGFLKKSITICENYIRNVKRDTDILNRIGIYYKNIGLIEKAINKFNESIKEDINNTKAHLNLSDIVNYKDADYNFKSLLMLSKKNFDAERLSFVFFSLSKVFKQRGNSKKFVCYLSKANNLMKKVVSFDIKEEKNNYGIVKNSLNQITFLSPKIELNKELNPIFIVGMPRSGTTLIESIISSHSLIQGLGELDCVNDILNNLFNFKSGSKKYLSLDDLKRINVTYFDKVKNLNLTKKIFTDKMPLNFRWINILNKAIPNAKFIHVYRNPIANCWSIYNLVFTSKGNRYSYSQEDLANFYKLYTEIMKDLNNKIGNKIYNCNYDGLVNKPKIEIKKLLNFLNLKFEGSCLNPHLNERPVFTASSLQVRKSIYKNSSNAYKEYIKFINPKIISLKKFSWS